MVSSCPTASAGKVKSSNQHCKTPHPCTPWAGHRGFFSHQRSSYANTSLARGVFRALTSASSAVLGQELSRCVRLSLAKAVSEALAWAREGSAVPGSVSREPYGARLETTEEPPVPRTALCEPVLLCRCDLPPSFPPSSSSLLCALLPPTPHAPSCCEAPHSFPHSHFPFSSPGLYFHSLLHFLCSDDQ